MSETTDTTTVLVGHQVELEKLFSKHQLMPRLRAEFQQSKEPDFIAHMEEHSIPANFGIDLLVQMHLHKRCDLPTLLGTLYHHFNNAQVTADMITKAAEADLVDFDTDTMKFIVAFEVSQDVQDDIDRFQYPLPMVVEPKPVTHNRESGYLLNNRSIILKKNHHDEDVCLDHINRMNKIRFKINHDVVKFVKNKWRNLDKPKDCETLENYQRRVAAFNKYDRTAKQVIEILQAHCEAFHLTHSYDKRGRTYAAGHHVNYQGNDWNKACIQFANEEIVPL